MRPVYALRRSFGFIALLLVCALFVTPAAAQQQQLGKVDFPTSGSPAAQAHFLRGLAALHSFWYEEALADFRKATEVDPKFMMGYWGEAMAHNHPLWSEQNAVEARKVLAKITGTAKLTERERAYIEAARVLYGEGDKLTRDKAYAAAMEKLYRAYPNDLEAAAFYSLSLLGMVRAGDKGYWRQALAGALALDVYAKNPDHPGAAHYIIHAFDDPEHAIIALPAARRYAQIAPEAHHARHMPSHIFVQLGMWSDVAASNESSWDASDKWVKRKSLPISLRDYHSLSWLLYAYAQQGRYKKALETLDILRDSMKQSSYENDMRPNYYENAYAEMVASFTVNSERWSEAKALFDAMPKAAAAKAAPAAASGEHAGHTMGAGNTTRPATQRHRVLAIFVNGLAAAMAKQTDEAQKSAAALAAIRAQASGQGAKINEIMELEIRALAASVSGRHDEAIELMKRATAIEEELSPPSGPPSLIKPSHELFGEILLRANRPKEAAAQFATALARQPNRTRSLLGAARAAVQNNNAKEATDAYTKLTQILAPADAGSAELREAQAYLKQ